MPTALHGTVTVNGDGTLNYTPDANYSGADTITYDVTDGTFTDTGQVAITVTAVADAPSLTSPDASGNEDTAIALSFSSALTDTDGSETLSINISGLAGATLNKGTLNGDGSYTLTSADLVGSHHHAARQQRCRHHADRDGDRDRDHLAATPRPPPTPSW